MSTSSPATEAQTVPGARSEGRIGPNSVLQLVTVLDAHLGATARDSLLRRAGLTELPGAEGLMPESPAVGLHRLLRHEHGAASAALLREAGSRTADYLLAHRIPRFVHWTLAALPQRRAIALLSRAIARNAWTFAGSGHFQYLARTPPVFLLHDNPLVRGDSAERPLCHWHTAVFERLFTVLIDPCLRVEETTCCAMGAPACRFTLH
jgi:divinyl protochlorophyllide a 8-vinyl-reductase